jgi:hypothetical protein
MPQTRCAGPLGVVSRGGAGGARARRVRDKPGGGCQLGARPGARTAPGVRRAQAGGALTLGLQAHLEAHTLARLVHHQRGRPAVERRGRRRRVQARAHARKQPPPCPAACIKPPPPPKATHRANASGPSAPRPSASAARMWFSAAAAASRGALPSSTPRSSSRRWGGGGWVVGGKGQVVGAQLRGLRALAACSRVGKVAG